MNCNEAIRLQSKSIRAYLYRYYVILHFLSELQLTLCSTDLTLGIIADLFRSKILLAFHAKIQTLTRFTLSLVCPR